MPEPISATDDQLRRLAAERVDRWIDDTDRRLRTAGEPARMPAQAWAGIPARRRPMWLDLVQHLARTGAEAFRRAAAPRRPEVAAQAFALLRDADPRLTERDAAQPSAAVKAMLEGLAARTEAGSELGAMAAAGDAAVAEFVERAPVLDDLRAARAVELGYVRDALVALIAPFGQAEDVVAGSHARKLLPLLVEETAAGAAARAAVPDLGRIERECERGLRDSLGKSLGEQYRALVGPLDAARTAAQGATARLAPASAAYGAMLAAYKDRWTDPRWNNPWGALEDLFGFYGLTMLRAILAISPEHARRVPNRLDPPYDRLRPDVMPINVTPTFRRVFPKGTSEQVLIWAFTELATTTIEPHKWLDTLERLLTSDPPTTPWPQELGPPAAPDI
ncbi:hypothetical protein [Streptodolium elevatio]|uniref:Uncharacterized protein n=1 Tax=Streptodolium elevatio TaxID=3157996 RepID=A0ABV3DR82_9ACTN